MDFKRDQRNPAEPDSLRKAQEEILRHRDWLRTVLIARTRGNHSLADDLLGDLTVEAMDSADKWSGLPETGPWLYRMAVRKFANYWRTEARRSRLNQRYCDELSRMHTAGQIDREPLEMMLDIELKSAVEAALKQIPRKDAEMLLLKYIHDWNYREMESYLGIPVAKIGNRLRVARNRLAAVLLNSSAIADWAEMKD